MKKFLLIILSIIYLTTTTGFTLNMHYCMGKLVATTPWSTNSDKCSNCGMKEGVGKDSGCCKDEHLQFKLAGDQKTGAIGLKFLQFEHSNTPHSDITVPRQILTTLKFNKQQDNLLLPGDSIAFYIRYCVFLI